MADFWEVVHVGSQEMMCVAPAQWSLRTADRKIHRSQEGPPRTGNGKKGLARDHSDGRPSETDLCWEPGPKTPRMVVRHVLDQSAAEEPRGI